MSASNYAGSSELQRPVSDMWTLRRPVEVTDFDSGFESESDGKSSPSLTRTLGLHEDSNHVPVIAEESLATPSDCHLRQKRVNQIQEESREQVPHAIKTPLNVGAQLVFRQLREINRVNAQRRVHTVRSKHFRRQY